MELIEPTINQSLLKTKYNIACKAIADPEAMRIVE